MFDNLNPQYNKLMDHQDHFGKFSSLENQLYSQDLNSHDLFTDYDFNILLAANNRLQHSALETKEQADLIEALLRLPAIGLKLQISPSLLKQMEKRAQHSKRQRTNLATETSSRGSRRRSMDRTRLDYDSEKLKASNLGAMLLCIGSWQLVARNEGDLVAKCYYAKKKLVWEILRNGLKKKIEIEWSDIIGIGASMEENKPGILLIELQNPPKFYKEIEPEPRKHTQWTNGTDFTEGQAYINRRHIIVFPPQVLDKHYQKMITYDKNLFELSQRPFPIFNCPYFNSPNLHNQHLPIIHHSIPQQQTAQCYNNQTLRLPCGIDNLTSPRSVVDFSPHFNEIIGCHGERMGTYQIEAEHYNVESSAHSEQYFNETAIDVSPINVSNGQFWNYQRDADQVYGMSASEAKEDLFKQMGINYVIQ